MASPTRRGIVTDGLFGTMVLKGSCLKKIRKDVEIEIAAERDVEHGLGGG